MTPEEFHGVISLLVAIAVLLWFFTHPWQHFCVDVARHRHFMLRDRLFILAVDGRIEFSDPTYRLLREWLNDRIRLAHTNRLSWCAEGKDSL